ncbi:Phosphotransferase enzyme family protein [Stieleria maiorica]|uniref:Phosphotransferase enzyme family protein n=1 Tax=Stieleria maiorica TaxID=2795974 RepID=A0A5B9MIZ4_9BACT|nr:phosphotransferase [Stieleria maiorica]QEF99614.1 Phosphotransferase enzyme family protein [Stieleria maiorica]
MSAVVQHRTSSRLCKRTWDGAVVYEKHYVTNDWDDDMDVIRRRAADELTLLNQLAASGLFKGRLGLLQIAASDPDAAMIATHEIPGASLDQYVMQGGDVVHNLAPWFLAGRWLKAFHSIPLTERATEATSRRDPTDMVEYCGLRLDSLAEYGYNWPKTSLRHSFLETIAELQRQVNATRYQRVWVHSDFSPGNLMWDGRTLTPIDFAMVSDGHPLADATYLIHRIEMHRVYRPWLRLPSHAIRRAVLRGLGLTESDHAAAYRMLMIKHLICRLHTYVRRPANSVKQAVHDRWVRGMIRRRLLRLNSADIA